MIRSGLYPMKKLLTLICCLVLLVGASGCADNDTDDPGFDEALLIGSWRLTERHWSDAEGENRETVQPKEAIVLTFLLDGTGTEAFGTNTSYVERFTYRVDRYLWIDYLQSDSSAYEVETLNDAVLVLVQSGSDEGGGWLERETYLRITP